MYHWYPNLWLIFVLLCEEILLIEVSILVCICVFYELHDIVITDHDIQVLVENLLYLLYSDQSLLFSVKKSKNVHSFFFFTPSIEPFLVNESQNVRKHELVLIIVSISDLVFNLLSVHFCEAKIAQNASQIFTIDAACFFIVVEVESILNLIFLR